ncbi:MAG: hypothetical protein IJU50_06330, partial [Lachnospiraceae bacterium]|nr:hypothetical protein [Lachnospiraceae bacterium]
MNKKLYNAMNWRQIEAVLYGDLSHPEEVLGPHPYGKKTILQAYFPGAEKVSVLQGKNEVQMEEMDNSFYASFLDNPNISYQYKLNLGNGYILKFPDPYAFGPQLSEEFLEEFANGKCIDAYRHLGAHVHTARLNSKSIKGTLFACYAPNANAVTLRVGRLSFLMVRRDQYGVYELFLPFKLTGEKYYFRIRKGVRVMERIDPYARGTLGGFSKVCEEIQTPKKLQEQKSDPSRMIIRRVDLSRIADLGNLVKETKQMGFSHLSLYFSENGSLFCPDPSFGSLEYFAKLIEECHQEGLGALLDWRIDGFAASMQHFHNFDGTALYEHEDSRRGYRSYDDRFLYQYQSPQVRSYLLSGAFFLVEELGADGVFVPNLGSVLYLDYHKAPGEWLPNFMGENVDRDAISLLQEFNLKMEEKRPEILRLSSIDAIWKDTTSSPKREGLGFQRTANEDFSRDFPDFILNDDSYRRSNFQRVLSGIQYAFVEPRFLALPEMPEEKFALAASLVMFLPGKKLFHLDDVEKEEALLKKLLAFYDKEAFLKENDDNEESFNFI